MRSAIRSPNQPVIFKVTQNDGLVAAGGAPGAERDRDDRRAGPRAGALDAGTSRGCRRQFASRPTRSASRASPIFTASGTQGAAGKIVVDTGNDQIGLIGQPLPKPFIAVVVDAGNNRLGGVPVTFTVQSRAAATSTDSRASPSPRDSDGRAAATLTLGSQEGNANNLVQANFHGQPALRRPASRASGRAPGNPADTMISGVVLDNSNVPIPGVTVRARADQRPALELRRRADGAVVP